MTAENDLIIVLVTVPNRAVGEELCRVLIEKRLAACVNFIPGITSIYRWKGEIENAEETLLVIKSRRELYSLLEEAVKTHHPYEVPEVIALNAAEVLAAYQRWVRDETKTE